MTVLPENVALSSHSEPRRRSKARSCAALLAVAFALLATAASADSLEIFGAALGGANHEFGTITATPWRVHAGRGAAGGVDWYFTDRLSAEVTVGEEREHARINGTTVTTFRAIPSAAFFEYHAIAGSLLDPYLGAGVSYLMYRGHVGTPYGSAAQPDHAALMTEAGVNYIATDHWRLMFGAEYGPARSTAEVNHPGAKTDKIDFHQLYIATGLRYRF